MEKAKRTMCMLEFNSTISSPRARRPGWPFRKTRHLVLAAFAIGVAGSAATAAPREVGLWFDDTGKGVVEIFECGPKLCGKIIWLKDPLNARGEPLTDGYNPDPKLRVRPICGLQILGELTRQPDGTWDEGWVYDPKVGKSYDAALELTGKDLILTGYKGVRFLSKSFTWTKAPPTLPKCDAPSTAASR